jgi:hypothetical protein
MHGTRTPLRTWFWAAYLVATHQPGISAKQLQRQLALARYETAWLILQKLRRAMVAPERELLKREVETTSSSSAATKKGSRAAASAARRRSSGSRSRSGGRLGAPAPAGVLPDASGSTLRDFTIATTAAGAIVHTDGLQSYSVLAKHGYDHRRRPQDTAAPGKQLLPRAHHAISTSRPGSPRRLRRALPVYLDEYVFRHNRRGTPMAAFQTLLGLGAIHQAHHLPPDHPPGRLRPNGINRIPTTDLRRRLRAEPAD